MPLSLITGPANAAKAGVVLDAARARSAQSPLLVVPTSADVDRYRRELAAGGAVLGVRIERFDGLLRELRRAAGVPGRTLTELQGRRVAAAAIAACRLERLAGAARTPGFAPALVAFAEELGEARVEPPRFVAALRAWAAQDPSRAPFAEELGALILAFRREQDRTGRRDRPRTVTAALDALREEPARWGGTPVFLYGFDDLSPLQRDVVDTLANAVGADIMMSLTFEPGRAAFAARATLHQDLLQLGATETRLDAVADYYAPAARDVLHHLERHLYEPTTARAAPGPALTALEGGGERAEVELVAAEVADLIDHHGYAPDEIAVVHRGLDAAAPLIDLVFRAYDIPVAVRRTIKVGHTALGRGLVAMIRCALLEATADDLLAWLRTPGQLTTPALADRLEARARREGARTAAQARVLWEQERWPLETLDHLRSAYEHGGVRALAERVAAETALLLAAPYRRQAPVFDAEGELDARVAAQTRRALRELAQLPPELQPDPEALVATIDDLEVYVGSQATAGRVAVTKPQSLRARRVRALFVLGCNEGVFPAPARPEPFLGDDDRRAINAASGLRLRLHEDQLNIERLFFYAAVSRPTERLALSWHAADDEGAPAVRSLLIDDVADLLDDPDWARRPKRRELGAAGWPAPQAPTEREAARFAAAAAPPAAPPLIAPLTTTAALGPLRERHTWSASQLEVWTACPVKWFVERHLRPEALVPDPEPLIRGELAHRVLEHALSSLAQDGGLAPERLPEARALVRAALAEHADDYRISPNPERLRALRRLEVDLVRYLEFAAHSGSEFTPERFEVQFGNAEDPHPPLELDGGALRLAGRIDRVDTDGREAIVYDYKGKTATEQAKWLEKGKLQIGLYMMALKHVLGLEPVGGFYQPLGGAESRPRGALLREADPRLQAFNNDRLDEHELDELLRACAAAARAAVDEIRAGALVPRPDGCAYQGGCAHPTICRCVTA